MIGTQHVRTSFASLFLVAALLFPSGIQFAHTLEAHEHPNCTDFSTHIHEKELDCSLCDFHLSVFDFDPSQEASISYISDNFNTIFGRTDSEGYSFDTYRALRGPPVLVMS
jgi:hypothetical protein